MKKSKVISVCLSVLAVAFCSAFGVAILGRAEKDPDRYSTDEIYEISEATFTEKVTSASQSTSTTALISSAATTSASVTTSLVTTTTLVGTSLVTESSVTTTTEKPVTSPVTTLTEVSDVVESSSQTVSEEPVFSETFVYEETMPEETEPPLPETEEFVVIIPESASEYQREVLRLVNEVRRAAGVREISGSEQLNYAADRRAEEIYRIFDHSRPDGREWESVLDEFGIQTGGYLGENIAAGMPTPAQVIDQWIASPDHYANMTNPYFTKIGVGFYEISDDPYHYYWVQIFEG